MNQQRSEALTSEQKTSPQSKIERLKVTLEMIKIEHTLFALPFAFLGAALAARDMPAQTPLFWVAKLVWITLAMVGARSAAMAFNRIADRRIDAANPRTAMRALPAGRDPAPDRTLVATRGARRGATIRRYPVPRR